MIEEEFYLESDLEEINEEMNKAWALCRKTNEYKQKKFG